MNVAILLWMGVSTWNNVRGYRLSACSSIGALDMMAHYDDSGEEEDKEDENVNSGPAGKYCL